MNSTGSEPQGGAEGKPSNTTPEPPQEPLHTPKASTAPTQNQQAPTSAMALILEALSTGIRTKPVKYVSTIAVCLLVIGFVIWTAVVAWIDLKDRLRKSEQQLETVAENAEKIEGIEVKAAEVDTIKAATEDASLINDARVELLEAEVDVLRKEIEIAEKKGKGESTILDTVSKTSTQAKAALIESSRRKPSSDAVLDDGVIDYKQAAKK